MTILKLACGHCDYKTEGAIEFATHMIETGHGIDPEEQKLLQDGADCTPLVRMLEQMQRDPKGEHVAEGMEISRVDPEDPDLPEEVRRELKKFEES